jgi:hypothetical protein
MSSRIADGTATVLLAIANPCSTDPAARSMLCPKDRIPLETMTADSNKATAIMSAITTFWFFISGPFRSHSYSLSTGDNLKSEGLGDGG